MKLFEFDKYFPNEESCKMKFKEIREQQGIVCKKCGCKYHYWLTNKQQFRCKQCKTSITLRSGTVMHGSKLPFRYWFIAMHLLTATKHTFSATEIKSQLNHKRYQSIWEMVHKLRSIMGKREQEYLLKGQVEVDEGFFTTEIPENEKYNKLKAGAGSQRKAKVLVMAESSKVTKEEKSNKKYKKEKKVGYIKMSVIEDLKSTTIDSEVINSIDSKAEIMSDATKSHSNFKNIFNKVESQVIKPEEIGKLLPWVHIAIGNSKSLFRDTYHGIKREYLQEYLNEFCYKFNRRYFGEGLFDRLMEISVMYQSDFEHKMYNRNIA
jgi:hypothetical protein